MIQKSLLFSWIAVIMIIITMIFTLYSVHAVDIDSVTTSPLKIVFNNFQTTSAVGLLKIKFYNPSQASNPEIDPMNLSDYILASPLIADVSSPNITFPELSIVWSSPSSQTDPNDGYTGVVQFSLSNAANFQIEVLLSDVITFRTKCEAVITEGVDIDNQSETYRGTVFNSFHGFQKTYIVANPALSQVDIFTNNIIGLNKDSCFFFSVNDDVIIVFASVFDHPTAKWTSGTTSSRGTLCIQMAPKTPWLHFTLTITGTVDTTTQFVIIDTVAVGSVADPSTLAFASSSFPSRIELSNNPRDAFDRIKVISIDSLSTTENPRPPGYTNIYTDGSSKSFYKWTISMLADASNPVQTISTLPSFGFEFESEIFSCLYHPEYSSFYSIDSNTPLTVHFLQPAFDSPTPALIYCYGAVSPWYKYRTNMNQVSLANEAPESWPFVTQLAISSSVSKPLYSSSELTIFPSIGTLPGITHTLSNELFLVTATGIFQQVKVQILVQGYSYSIGLEITLPNNVSIIKESSNKPVGTNAVSLFCYLPPPTNSGLFNQRDDDTTFVSSPDSTTHTTYTALFAKTQCVDLKYTFYLSIPLQFSPPSSETTLSSMMSFSVIKYKNLTENILPSKPLKIFEVPFNLQPTLRVPQITGALLSGISKTPFPLKITQQSSSSPPSSVSAKPTINLATTYLNFQFNPLASSTTLDSVKISFYHFLTSNPPVPVLLEAGDELYLSSQFDVTKPIITSLTSTLPKDSSLIFFVMVEYKTKTTGLDVLSTSYFITETFSTILPKCFAQRSTDYFDTDYSIWPSLCEGQGICGHSGECICKNSISGSFCDIQPCGDCVSTHLQTCKISDGLFNTNLKAIIGGECKCNSNWLGDLCDVPIGCTEASKLQCKNNGLLIVFNNNITPPACDTTQPCQCVDSWTGMTCSICSLQCKNGGRINPKQCATCECPEGYIGTNCEFQGVNVQFTINGYNTIVASHFSRISKGFEPEPQTFESYEMVSFYVSNIITQLLGIDTQSIQNLQISSIVRELPLIESTGSSQLTFEIYYGSPSFNPSIDSQQMTDLFNNELLTNFIAHRTIQHIFVFPTSTSDNETPGTIDSKITPFASTLGEQPNSAITHHFLSFIFLLSSLILIHF